MRTPYYREQALEGIAREVITAYDPNLYYGVPRMIPIEDIIEAQGITLEYQCLRKTGCVLGETIFDDGGAIIYDYDMRLVIVAQGVRDSVQSAIVAVATENWDEAYPGLREGYSGGYQLSGSSWTQNVTTGNVYDRLQQVLGLVYEDGRYLKYAGPDLEYRFYDLHMELENAPLAPSAPAGITQFNVTGTVTVEVPLSFGFGHLPPMQITMKLNAKYVPRF